MMSLKDFQKRIKETLVKKAKSDDRINALKAELDKLNANMDAALYAGDEEKAMEISDSITRKETEIEIAQRVNDRREYQRGFSDSDLIESYEAEIAPQIQKIEVSGRNIQEDALRLVRAYAAAGKIRNDALAIREQYLKLAEDKNAKFAKVQQLPDIFPGESWKAWNMIVKDERAAWVLQNIRTSQAYSPAYEDALRKYL